MQVHDSGVSDSHLHTATDVGTEPTTPIEFEQGGKTFTVPFDQHMLELLEGRLAGGKTITVADSDDELDQFLRDHDMSPGECTMTTDLPPAKMHLKPSSAQVFF